MEQGKYSNLRSKQRLVSNPSGPKWMLPIWTYPLCIFPDTHTSLSLVCNNNIDSLPFLGSNR